MQILLANAKMMLCPTEVAAKPLTIPAFQAEADRLAKEMARLSLDELEEQLGCSRQLALENQQRYQNFFLAEKMPAIMAYNGRAYQALLAHTLDAAVLSFAQEHLFITCFLYGLLRPMDAIVPYRMEHTVRLESDQAPLLCSQAGPAPRASRLGKSLPRRYGAPSAPNCG